MQNHDHEPRFDPAIFAGLKKVLEDDVYELLDLYDEIGPSLAARISHGCASGDIEEITVAAHTLKSNSAQLGALRLSALCRELEELSHTHPSHDFHPYARAIHDEVQQVLAELQQLPR